MHGHDDHDGHDGYDGHDGQTGHVGHDGHDYRIKGPFVSRLIMASIILSLILLIASFGVKQIIFLFVIW